MASRVLRPTGTTTNSGWVVSSGTLHGVLSDESDGSYADGNGTDSFEVALDPSAFDPADLSSTTGYSVLVRAGSSGGYGDVKVYSGSDLLSTHALAVESLSPDNYGSESGQSQGSFPSGAKPTRVVVEMTSGDLTIYEISVTYEDAPAPPHSTRRRSPASALFLGSE